MEKIHGPIVTICGGADQVWPSCDAAGVIDGRRSAHHSPYRDTALSYPAAGHLVGNANCYYSTTATTGSTAAGLTMDYGGTVEANAQASADAHARILAFLETL